MASLAEKRMVDAEDDSDESDEARPEELRLLEALLFASAEPLDEKTLAAAAARRRRRQGRRWRSCRRNTPRAASISSGSAANGRSAPPAIWPG